MARNTAIAVAVVAGTLAVVWGARARAAQSGHPLADRCELFRLGGVEDARTESCVRCHDGRLASGGSNHPVNMDYAEAARRRATSMMPLRSAEDVVARGLFLPDGELRCVTCHDGRSRWKYGLAIPSGAAPQPAVNPRDPSTYAGGAAQQQREAEVRAAQENGAYGVRVSPKPLCLACHAID